MGRQGLQSPLASGGAKGLRARQQERVRGQFTAGYVCQGCDGRYLLAHHSTSLGFQGTSGGLSSMRLMERLGAIPNGVDQTPGSQEELFLEGQNNILTCGSSLHLLIYIHWA
eukprot:83312-Chlamydomonas_euryale.AAC.12